MKHGKKYNAAAETVDRQEVYELPEAVKILKSMPSVEFDESVDVAVKLGVDPRHRLGHRVQPRA